MAGNEAHSQGGRTIGPSGTETVLYSFTGGADGGYARAQRRSPKPGYLQDRAMVVGPLWSALDACSSRTRPTALAVADFNGDGTGSVRCQQSRR
jgi:hypothetical protein